MFVLRNINIRMPLLAVAMLDMYVKSCSENEFMLPDTICCSFCTEGRYRAVNCTRQSGFVASGRCKLCTKCADGMQMIADCTNFTDTKCAVKENVTAITELMATVTPTISGEPLVMHIALCLTPTVVFAMIIAAVVYKWCTRRNISRDPAGEPFKIMI